MNAFDIGKNSAGRLISRRDRAALLREAGIEPTSETVEAFEAGRTAGEAQAAREAEQTARQNRAACEAAGITIVRTGRYLVAHGIDYRLSQVLGQIGWKWDPQNKVRCRGYRKDGTVEIEAFNALAAELNRVHLDDLQTDFEREITKDVEPDWPTYRRVLEAAMRVVEFTDARRYGDWKDVDLFKNAAADLVNMLNEIRFDAESAVGKIVEECLCGGRPRMTARQAKLIAVTAGKHVALTGSRKGEAVTRR